MTRSNRRAFLTKVSVAGGCLAWGGLTRSPCLADPKPARPSSSTAPTAGASNAPVVVVAPAVSADVDPRAPAWIYVVEILRRAGVFFELLPPAELPNLSRRPKCVVVLAGNVPLGSNEREALAAWVKQGGALLGIGGVSTLPEVFGVSGETPLSEGWMKVVAADHPVTAHLRSSLHVFGGYAMKRGAGAVLAEVSSGKQGAQGSAVLENRFGQGRAMVLGPDLLFSIVHIQQGLPVFQDGHPSPDDSAPINEGILKAEDGLVLDWQRDRTPLPPDNKPVFLEPISDELREIVLRGVFHLAREQGVALPVLWYWPRGLKAVGHISHDSDGNDPQKAAALLEVMNRCKIKSTWCMLYPGGYPRQFYRALAEQGYEIALHYDARTGGKETSWSKDNFLLQHRWLLKEAGLRELAGNKNHFTRWEGRLDLYRWCEATGLVYDQSRGPSKQGTIGFPLGGSQPYFPLDDEAATPRFFRVMEVNMLTQDLVVVCPAEYGKPLLDSARRHHGVAHFLFHPAHIQKPGVADTIAALVDYGRAQEMEWWTNEQICRWESLRREVEARFTPSGAVALRASRPVSQATLLVLKPAQGPRAITINGRAVKTDPWTLYGFEFQGVTTDLAGEVHLHMG